MQSAPRSRAQEMACSRKEGWGRERVGGWLLAQASSVQSSTGRVVMPAHGFLHKMCMRVSVCSCYAP